MVQQGWGNPRHLLAALAAAVLVIGCTKSDPDADVGADGDVDGDADTDVDGDADGDGGDDADAESGGDSGAELPEAVEEALVAVTEGMTAAAALGGPLVEDGEELRDAEGTDCPGGLRDSTTRTRVEDAVAGNSIVSNGSCAAFEWSGLSVTVTFTSCTLELTGEPLDGSVTMGISFGPLTFTMTFTDLTAGDATMDGTVSLNLGGACSDSDPDCTQCADGDLECAAEQDEQRTLEAEMTLTMDGDFSISLDDILISTDPTGTTVSGQGTVASETFTGSFTATDLRVETGDCLPSSGTLALDDGSMFTTTVTFLGTTPETGVVSMQLGAFPAAEVPLLPPCTE